MNMALNIYSRLNKHFSDLYENHTVAYWYQVHCTLQSECYMKIKFIKILSVVQTSFVPSSAPMGIFLYCQNIQQQLDKHPCKQN